MELSSMSDLTAGAGEAYTACKALFEDLNRLAIDFGHAIRNTGVDLPKSEEYSYSPHELFVKRDHVWMSYRLDENMLAFAAAYVIFEKGTAHIKVGPPGRPEIWFLLGRATKPKTNMAAAIRDMFMEVELPRFAPKLTVGGAIAHYNYDVAGEVWSVVLLGLELGEIDTPEALERRVVGPLRAAAAAHSIQL
jgi:hypothetical protein